MGLIAVLAIASPFWISQGTEQPLSPIEKQTQNSSSSLTPEAPLSSQLAATTVAPASPASPIDKPTSTPTSDSSTPVATNKMEPTTTTKAPDAIKSPKDDALHELIVFFGVSPTDTNTIISNALNNTNLDAFSGATRITQKQSLLNKKQLQNVGGEPYTKNVTTIPSLTYIAALLRAETQAKIYNIVTTTNYPRQTAKLFAYVRKEKNENIMPELTDDAVIDLDEAALIYLCYPIWLNEIPQAVRSFLLKYDLSGKIIVPVIVHYNPFNDKTLRTLASAEPNATIYSPALTIQTGLLSNLKKLHQEVKQYLKDLEEKKPALEQWQN